MTLLVMDLLTGDDGEQGVEWKTDLSQTENEKDSGVRSAQVCVSS